MIEFLALFALSIMCYIVLIQRKSPLDVIPGPRPYPLVGNALQLDADRLYVQLTAMGKKYGGLIKLYMFTKPVVVVSDSALIHEALVTRSREFAGRPQSFSNKLLVEHLSSAGFIDAGPVHKARRQNIQKYLKQFGAGMQKIEDVTRTATDDLMRRLSDARGGAVDVREMLVQCVSDVMVIFLIGESISQEEYQLMINTTEKEIKALTAGSSIVLDMFPWTRYLRNNTYRLLYEAHAGKNELIGGFMARKPTDGYVSHLQSMSEQELRSVFLESHEEQMNSIFELLISGIYTTSSTLTTLVHVLCHYPGIQAKIHAEIIDVIGPSRHPTLQDKNSMPYLRATLLEIGRFGSIAPFMLPHKAMEDCMLGGYTIPKDTEVWLNSWAMHHDENLWDEPFQFQPERFLESGRLIPPDHPHRLHLLPFSAGHRVCVGEVFATSRVFLIVARMLQNFSILPETTLERQPSCDPRDMDMTIVNLPPPFKVRLVDHESCMEATLGPFH